MVKAHECKRFCLSSKIIDQNQKLILIYIFNTGYGDLSILQIFEGVLDRKSRTSSQTNNTFLIYKCIKFKFNAKRKLIERVVPFSKGYPKVGNYAQVLVL